MYCEIPAESLLPPSSFPQYGKLFRDFSTLWKNIFHTMENVLAIFPHNGKTFRQFSTQWKEFVHTV
jgi:hypothetical protein